MCRKNFKAVVLRKVDQLPADIFMTRAMLLKINMGISFEVIMTSIFSPSYVLHGHRNNTFPEVKPFQNLLTN